MKLRCFAVLSLVTGLCLTGVGFGQTIKTIPARLVRLTDLGAVVRGGSPGNSTGAFAGDLGRLPGLRGSAFTRLSFLPTPRPFASRPLAIRPATADAWNTGSGDWSVAGNWTSGVPTSSSAVTIGNTTSATVTEDLASASAASLSITSSNELYIAPGNSLTVTGATNVSSGAELLVGTGDGAGNTLNSGSVTNSGTMDIGNYYMTSSSTVNVTGTYTGTGGTLVVDSGNTAGANSLLKISGAAPGTVTGTYVVETNLGSSTVEWGSGGITAIGDGSSNAGNVTVNGATAYLEVGATNSNSALKGLTTIASNGELQLENGAAASTTGALTVAAGGQLYLDFSNTGGGSSLTLGGSLTNSGTIQVGNYYTSSADTVNVAGTYTGTGATLTVIGGHYSAGANSLVDMSGAAPGTALGNYYLTSNEGSAIVEWGSGDITAIGNGTNSGNIELDGASTYLEVGATNSNSALRGLTSIASDGTLQLENGASATTTGALTVAAGGLLYVDAANTGGGSSLTLGGSLTNDSTVQVGNFYTSLADTLKVNGTYTGTGATLNVIGGNYSAGANSLVDITGAAPGTALGNYYLTANEGSAIVEWGSGGITAIGNGSNAGNIELDGASTYLEVGATNSNSALTGLTSIASDGVLQLENGASATTTGALTVAAGGLLYVDAASTGGGSSLTLGGSLTNDSTVQVGNFYTSLADTLKVNGTYTGTGATLNVIGGNYGAGADSLVNITGAAPGTVTGNYYLTSHEGSATVEWGSGGITAIGNGSGNAGAVSLDGATTYMEVGATNSNSALKGLTTIASNGNLQLADGASVTTTGALTLAAGGALGVDAGSTGGGSVLSLGGSLTNDSTVGVGNFYTSSAVTLDVDGTYTGTGATLKVTGGNYSAGANALVDITGAAPGTLTGNYELTANEGSAAVEWGSGGITSIGNGTEAGYAFLSGGAYLEVGATNTNSALKTLTTIASDGDLQMQDGASATTTGALTVAAGGQLYVDAGSAGGGSSLTLGGSLTSSGTVQVGNFYTNSPETLKVNGTYTGTGGTLTVVGGNYAAGANALVDVTGAAPGTVTGNYNLTSNEGSAAVEFGSGGITAIGDGSSNAGDVSLNGGGAYLEVGAANSNSALKGLTTIASNGELQLVNGASVTTTGALTVASGGQLSVDSSGNGGSTLNIGGALTNGTTIQVGNYYMGAPSALDVGGSLTNTNTINLDPQGYNSGTTKVVLEVTGPDLVNSGTINLYGNTGEAELEIGGNVTTSGTGAIKLSTGATNLITGTSSSFTLTNGSTIEGSGTISNMGIVNTGTISANQSVPLLILPSSLGLNNQGTLSVSTGDTMQIGTSAGGALTNLSGTTLTGGTYTVGGTMQFGASGASIVTDAANISLTGAGAQMLNFGGSSLLTNLATISNGGSFTLGTGWGTFTTTGNFTNDGALSVGAKDKFIVDLSDSLTNFSGTTLTGGTYKITGTLEFKGANIVTNDASITLTGAGSKIDGKGGANGLANFAVNNGSFILGKGRSFTTAGNFTNNGLLTVGAGDTFDVNGNLTNFSGNTLNSGNYNVSGILEFDNASIVTNAATITLGSTTAKIENQSAANAMLGFTTNTSTGKFTLSGNAGLTTTGGSFSNAGTVTVDTGSTFIIGGSSYNYTQTAGTTTVDGTLAGASTGSLDLNGGNLYGTGSLNYGVSDSATITPGNSSTSEGKLQVNGTYAQNSSGALDVTIGGTTAGTNYDQLNVSGTASLNGTLNISLAHGYTPTVGTTFDILNASSVTGSFSTVNGVAINSNEHFTVTEISGDEIELTVVSGPAPTMSVSLTPAAHPGVEHGRYGLGVYRPSRLPVNTIATVATPVSAPALAHVLAPVISGLRIGRGFHAMDDFGVPVAMPSGSGSSDVGVPALPGISPVSALAYNPMASMNHAYFECGVSLNALRHVGGKRLLKSLWAAPDSPDALSIGYMRMTTSH
ncbi:MAG: beta strand repeat-containing protein [Bryobacteraceae bacterium]